MPPFLMTPNDSTSTPAFQVSSAGETFCATTAFAKRAPSMCTLMPRVMRDRRERARFRRRVDRAAFRGLGDGQRARLHAVHVRLEPVEPRREIRGRDLRARAADQRKFRAAREELRRAAFVALDVRFGVRQHRAPGRTQRRQRQRVGRRARRHGEYAHLACRRTSRTRRRAIRPAVRAVGERDAAVGGGDRVEDFAADRGRVVGFEVAHRASILLGCSHATPRVRNVVTARNGFCRDFATCAES